MRFVRVEFIPEIKRGRNRNNLGSILDNFVASDMICAKVALDPGDYSSPECARTSLVQAIKRGHYNVGVTCRNGELYIVRKDM